MVYEVFSMGSAMHRVAVWRQMAVCKGAALQPNLQAFVSGRVDRGSDWNRRSLGFNGWIDEGSLTWDQGRTDGVTEQELESGCRNPVAYVECAAISSDYDVVRTDEMQSVAAIFCVIRHSLQMKTIRCTETCVATRYQSLLDQVSVMHCITLKPSTCPSIRQARTLLFCHLF